MAIQLGYEHDGNLDPAEARRMLERDAMLDAEQRESLPAIIEREIAERTLAFYAVLGALGLMRN